MNISELTRQNILDGLQILRVRWAGGLEEPDFLERIFNLSEMASTDGRFSNAYGDIYQHRVNNDDWEDNWVYSDRRFNLIRCPDELFLQFLCETVHPLVRSDTAEIDRILELYNEQLACAGFEIIPFSEIAGFPIYTARRSINRSPSLGIAKSQFDIEYLSRQITRIESSINDDPELAIGTSKELIETCCKTILTERGVELDDNWDVPKLVKQTCKVLKLTPDDIPDTAKSAETIKRILSNLASVTHGIAELRNDYGTGHGKSARSKGLNQRHAQLAAGAATTLVIFLFDTHEFRKLAETVSK